MIETLRRTVDPGSKDLGLGGAGLRDMGKTHVGDGVAKSGHNVTPESRRESQMIGGIRICTSSPSSSSGLAAASGVSPASSLHQSAVAGSSTGLTPARTLWPTCGTELFDRPTTRSPSYVPDLATPRTELAQLRAELALERTKRRDIEAQAQMLQAEAESLRASTATPVGGSEHELGSRHYKRWHEAIDVVMQHNAIWRRTPEAKGVAEWDSAKWVQSLRVHELVAEIIGPAATASPGMALAHLVSLTVREGEMERLLSQGQLVQRLAALLRAGGRELMTRLDAPTGALLNRKFCEDTDVFELVFGHLSIFFDGLERLIGAPLFTHGSLLETMEHEHTRFADVRELFTSSNGITTFSADEWEFVFAAQPSKAYGNSLNQHQRKALSLDELKHRMTQQNERLRAQDHAPLCEEEVIGARLYSGPMYEK